MDRKHVHDLLDRGVDDKGPSDQHDEGVHVELKLQQAAPVHSEKGGLEALDRRDHHEQQDDAQRDRQADANTSHPLLLVGRNPAGLDGDVQQVVEAEHSLQEDEHEQGAEVGQGEEFSHGSDSSE